MAQAHSIPQNFAMPCNAPKGATLPSVPAELRPERILWPIAIALLGLSAGLGLNARHQSFQTRIAARQKQLRIEQTLSPWEEEVAGSEPPMKTSVRSMEQSASGFRPRSRR